MQDVTLALRPVLIVIARGALGLELLGVAHQEALYGGPAAARPDVPHGSRAPVAVQH